MKLVLRAVRGECVPNRSGHISENISIPFPWPTAAQGQIEPQLLVSVSPDSREGDWRRTPPTPGDYTQTQNLHQAAGGW